MLTVCIAGDRDDCCSGHLPSPATEEDLGCALRLPLWIPRGSHHLHSGEDDGSDWTVPNQQGTADHKIKSEGMVREHGDFVISMVVCTPRPHF